MGSGSGLDIRCSKDLDTVNGRRRHKKSTRNILKRTQLFTKTVVTIEEPVVADSIAIYKG